ncbi:MAG: hypothetical protein KGM42_10590 [Hyphomicrobiales bacterium]|nr:hypothetical protein [Hyphomicrobiales bacterium]
MDELTTLPKFPANARAPERIVEIVVDPRAERRSRRRQIGLAAVVLAVLAAPVWAYEFYQRQASAAHEAALQAAQREAALKDASQRQIGALRDALHSLQSKLDDSERRQLQDKARASSAIATLEKKIQETRDDTRTTAHQLSERIGRTADRIQKVETTRIDRTPVGTIPHAPSAQSASGPVAPKAVAPVEAARREAHSSPLAGYSLRDVDDGMALIGVRGELIEVAPGDTLPGAGRVLGIQRRAGAWVVRTEQGEIVGAQAAPPREVRFGREYYGMAPGGAYAPPPWARY